MSEGFPLAPGGSRIAGYRLEEEIGRGGMAVVFRARDEGLDRLVALKILAPVLAADEGFRRRFLRESRSAAAVDDPHIIPVHEAGEADGVLFIAMRYVPGGDVRSLVQREGPLSPSRAAAIISSVASALDAAHSAGLVHRDVKPANMLLDVRPGRPDHVYLADFGLSKGTLSSVGLTGTEQFLGTLDYAAPEHIEGRAIDGRTDEYALACSAFELLTGAPPFPRDQSMAVLYAQLSTPPPLLTSRQPGLPPAADAVLTRALAKAKADRYPTCREFGDALRQALGLARYDSGPGVSPRPSPGAALAPPRSSFAGMPPLPAMQAPVPGAFTPSPAASGLGSAAGTVLRRYVHGDAKDESAPARTGASSSPETQSRGTRTKRPGRRGGPAVLALSAAVVVLAAATGVLLTRSQPPGSPQAASWAFAPQQYPDGLLIMRRWTLSGNHGSLLTEAVTASSATGKAIRVRFQEAIPAVIAPTLQTVRFTPVPSTIVRADPVVEWDLRLPVQGTVTIGYRAAVPPAGATRARLARWVSAFDALAATLTGPQGITIQFRSLSIKPRTLRIAPGDTARLALSGRVGNGKSAPHQILSGAAWTAGNPAVATVDTTGLVTGIAPGSTYVTAQVGTARVQAAVTVTGPGAVAVGSSPPSNGTGGSASPTPTGTTPSFHSPTPTPTPTPRIHSKTVLVHANTPVTPIGGGQGTGVHLARGQRFSITATGLIIYGYESTNCTGYPRTDPAGNRTSSVTGKSCGKKLDNNVAMPSPSSPVGSLLWRVGDSGWSEAEKSKYITAPQDGVLYLGVNDDTVQDNDRFFTVKVTR